MNGRKLTRQAYYGSGRLAFPYLLPVLLSKALTFFFAYVTVSFISSFLKKKKRARERELLNSYYLFLERLGNFKSSVMVQNTKQVSALANRTHNQALGSCLVFL